MAQSMVPRVALMMLLCATFSIAGINLAARDPIPSRMPFMALLRENDVAVPVGDTTSFLDRITLGPQEVVGLRTIIRDRRKLFGLFGEIPLELAFDPKTSSPTNLFYFEIAKSGRAFLFDVTNDKQSEAVRRLDRGGPSKNEQDALDNAAALQVRIDSLQREMQERYGALRDNLNANYESLKYNITALYSVLGVITALGIIKMLPRKKNTTVTAPASTETRREKALG